MLLFSAMAVLSPHRDISDIGPIMALGALQILEPKLAFVAATRGKVVWIILKLVFCWILIGFTGGLESSYYWILLLPVISAGTSLGRAGVTSGVGTNSGCAVFGVWPGAELGSAV